MAYSNIFQNEFVWDDERFFVDWKQIKDFQNIPDLLIGSLPEGHGGGYRPIRSIFYTTSYHLFGTDPFGYHLQSLLVHLLCTCLVYLIALQLTKKNMLALITSLLFGVHPIHTEAITFITSSFDIIGVVFFFAAFYFYLLSRQKSNGNSKRYLQGAYFLSILCAAMAFFTYEMTLTLPFLLLLFDFTSHKRFGLITRKGLMRHIPYFAFAGIYLSIRFFVLNTPTRSGYFTDSLYLTALTMVKAFAKYLLIGILPINPSINHILPNGIMTLHVLENNESIILAQSLFDLPVISAVLLLVAVLSVAVALFRRRPLVSFSIGWFFIGLLPVSNLLFPFGTIMAERYLYISSFAACLLVAHLISKLHGLNHPKCLKITAIFLFTSLFLFYTCQTYDRNNDWKNEETLWKESFKQSPDCPHIINNLGTVYMDQGKYEEATMYFNKALQRKDDYPLPYINLGRVYSKIKDINKSITYFLKGMESHPNITQFHFEIAEVYFQQSQPTLAIEHYQNALKFSSGSHKLYYKLGACYLLLGKHRAALAEFRRTLQLNEKHAPSYKAIGAIFIQEKRYKLAVKYLTKSLSLNQKNANAWELLGAAHYELNQTEKAITAWEKALQIEDDEQIRENLQKLQGYRKNGQDE